MKKLYQRYESRLIMFDANYHATKYALPLFFIVVKTNVNYQVCHGLVYLGIHYSGTLSKLFIPMFLT